MYKQFNESIIFKTPISIINLNSVTDTLIKKNLQTIAVCNLNTVVSSDKNQKLENIIKSFSLRIADGMPIVWELNRRGITQERLNGHKVLSATIEKGLNNETKHFFLGSSEQVLNGLQKNLKTLYPSVKIVGLLAPPFGSDKEILDFVELNIEKILKADILWIGLGMPKQEILMHSLMKYDINQVGVGAVFEWVAGTKKTAPAFMQNVGLEWLYRLIREPKRLWRRYFFDFVYILKKMTMKIFNFSA
jgi:N-acetylglucosaminyldiphosphoundecaprenol N-acetyl-beta-D-mannosaminyltransferase